METFSNLTELSQEQGDLPTLVCITSTNKVHNKPCQIQLNEDVIELLPNPIQNGNNKNKKLLEEFRISDIFGINIISCRPPLSNGVYIQLICFPKTSPKFFSCSSGRHKIRKKVQILLQVNQTDSSLEENENLAWEWVQKLHILLAEIYPFRMKRIGGGRGLLSKRRMLAIVNPKSGRRNGIAVFKVGIK